MNSCSQERALSCLVGDLTGRHGSISLTKRQLYNDILLQLAGDFTGRKYLSHLCRRDTFMGWNGILHRNCLNVLPPAVQRSLVLRLNSTTTACADIHPKSPSAMQIFPNRASFSRCVQKSRNVL